MTEQQIHDAVKRAMDIETFKENRRFGKEAEENRINAKALIESGGACEAIVKANKVSHTNSLSAVEWGGMEGAMPAEEAQTHRNLAVWMQERARSKGVKAQEDDDDDEDDPELTRLLDSVGDFAAGAEGDGGDSDEEEAPVKGKKNEKEKEKDEDDASGTVEKSKNWSAVNLTFRESKLTLRGSLNPTSLTNWVWYRCIRPKLEETKAKLPELDTSNGAFGIEDVDEIFGEFMPVKEKKDKDKDKDKSKDKDKDKDKDKKKDKKDKKSKKDTVTLSTKEKIQAQHFIKDMIFGESGKGKKAVSGWFQMVGETDISNLIPWEFQIGNVMFKCMQLEYSTKKKKENPDRMFFYEMVQSLSDAISMLRKQYSMDSEFANVPHAQILPLQDALMLQERFKAGSVGTLKFDLLWYLQNGAQLLAGSNFMKRHKTTVFKPFKIQELMVDAIASPGPQLVFGIAPPGTGKTAVVSHLLSLFPGQSLVFCCAALPVVLGVGRICHTLGVPYAFVKARRLTPSYACGRGLGGHVDFPGDEIKPAMDAVSHLRYNVAALNLQRKQKRLAEKRRLRNIHNLKRMPKMYLMCDVSSCAWLLRQLDPNRTILVVDEPPMGSDTYPSNPEENPLSCAMVQTMLTSPYKAIWMSATLPRPRAMPTFVNGFLERFLIPSDKRDQHVNECFSTELDRGALMCGPSGKVAFPHQSCSTAADLQKLCDRLPGDPLVLKAYTERALATLLERWQILEAEKRLNEAFLKNAVPPHVKFADLSELSHASIRAYAVEILNAVAMHGSDDMVAGFCAHRDAGEKPTFPEFNLEEMLFGNAYAFPGLILVSDSNPSELLLSMSKRLQEHMPKASALDEDIKAQQAADAKAQKYAEDGEVVEAAQTKLKFSSDLVIQSEQFLKRWCPNRPKDSPTLPRLLPTIKEFVVIKELPVTEQWQMLALSGAGSFDPKLDTDSSNPVYTQWVHEAMTANRLACVTAGKEFTWGANVPASTVVVTKSFAETTSVAGMLQYVGRAARRGLTTHGQAIFEREEDLERIFSTSDGISTEALTMERYAKWWLSGGTEW
jgi:hypothetical protein